MNLRDCHNFEDFRKLAKKKLPSPIFNYIDGGADDEITLKRNTDSFNKCDLIPNVLTGASDIDLSTTVLGQKIDFPLFLSATAMHRLYHHEGELATARAAETMGTMLAGQAVEAFYTSLEHMNPLYIGLNCATGPEFMRDHIRTLAQISKFPVSVVPNAGIPDEEGVYPESPKMLADILESFMQEILFELYINSCLYFSPLKLLITFIILFFSNFKFFAIANIKERFSLLPDVLK